MGSGDSRVISFWARAFGRMDSVRAATTINESGDFKLAPPSR
jgi:hypothetical protein